MTPSDSLPPIDGARVLAIIPHPDDEAYTFAGLLAALTRAGARAQVVCATRGEGGPMLGPDQTTPLADQRSSSLTIRLPPLERSEKNALCQDFAELDSKI